LTLIFLKHSNISFLHHIRSFLSSLADVCFGKSYLLRHLLIIRVWFKTMARYELENDFELNRVRTSRSSSDISSEKLRFYEFRTLLLQEEAKGMKLEVSRLMAELTKSRVFVEAQNKMLHEMDSAVVTESKLISDFSLEIRNSVNQEIRDANIGNFATLTSFKQENFINRVSSNCRHFVSFICKLSD